MAGRALDLSKKDLMPKLRMSAFVEEGIMNVRMNDDMILPGEGGDLELSLEKGKKYYLNWYVEGRAKSHFRISVSSPKEAELHLSKILDSNGSDFGYFPFEITT